MAVLSASTFLVARNRVKRPFRIGLLAILSLFLNEARSPAETTASKEYRVKAVFLYNFSQFVAWPKQAFPEKQTPLVIGIIGDDPFGSYLDQVVSGEKVNSHPLVVKRYRQVDEIKNCHILFISPGETKRLEEILTELRNRSILTVGETDGFAQRGGMIRFATENNKVGLRINAEAAKAAGLIISSKLLRLAEIVPAGKD